MHLLDMNVSHVLAIHYIIWRTLLVGELALLSSSSHTFGNIHSSIALQPNLTSFSVLALDMRTFSPVALSIVQWWLPSCRGAYRPHQIFEDLLCTSAGLIKIWSTIEPDPHFRYVFTSPLFAINIYNYTKASNKHFYVWVSFPEPFWPKYQRCANTCLCTVSKEST